MQEFIGYQLSHIIALEKLVQNAKHGAYAAWETIFV